MRLIACLSGIVVATTVFAFTAHAAVTTEVVKRTPADGVPLV